jgi:hypothetical protein
VNLPRLSEEPEVVKPDPADLHLWSVTTILGALDKPALVAWAALETAKAAVDEERIWRSRLEHEGREEAIAWLKGSRYRRRKGQRSSTDLGIAVHKACEHKALYGTWRPEDIRDPELLPFCRQWDRFLDEFQPEYIAAEVTVFAPEWGYAGTSDGAFVIEHVPLIFDTKTSREDQLADGSLRTPFPEIGLQLAAYRYAELAAVWRARATEQFKRRYYLLSEPERQLAVPVPEVDGGVGILLTPTRYAVHPVACDKAMHDVFLHLVDVAAHQFGRADSVVGRPMLPPYPMAETDPFAGLPVEEKA